VTGDEGSINGDGALTDTVVSGGGGGGG